MSLSNRSASDIMEIERLKALPPGSSIRGCREKGGWIQCKLVRVHGHQVEFLLPSGRQSSSTIAAVRAMNAATNSLPITLLTSTSNSTPEVNFRFARLRELKGLEERGTFSIVKRD
jgi:hypothetical protein